MAHDGHEHDHGDRRFSFEKVAKLDSADRRERQPPERLAEVLAPAADATVLDVGVGTGYFAIAIARRLAAQNDKGRVVGADIEPRMLGILRDRAREAGVAERVDGIIVPDDGPFSLPLADGAVDAAVLAMIYHEFPDRSRALAEVKRVLRPGAAVLILDWDPEGDPEGGGPPLDHRIPFDRAAEELRRAGFTAPTRVPLYDNTWLLRAER